MMNHSEEVIAQTRHWVRHFIIEYGICPFAKREVDRQTLRLAVADSQNTEQALLQLMEEVSLLDRDSAIATTLLIFPRQFQSFFDYLDFLDLAEQLLNDSGYEGVYQLASFHPDYCFDHVDFNDAANYTNRSPYPMLHLLREDQVEQAIAYYGDTSRIPLRNIEKMHELGVTALEECLASCRLGSENGEK
ncbi:DUF1415 family protein [Legionella sp. MW5194]|uniref:DUF1415 domain-containing protein n=1 Tax=Legionella sp. MW5194 TaxID=2662448 RepID=UPI00193CF1E3|nr:DUF1415 domain-containing protein [Legionella sp. MW5194]QRN02746.1 DUF1415 family protein [Legionella sp. MW5194]